jgi:hypothetical protein
MNILRLPEYHKKKKYPKIVHLMTVNAVARLCLSYGFGKWTVTVSNRRRLASAEMCLSKSELKREGNNCGKESSYHVEECSTQ